MMSLKLSKINLTQSVKFSWLVSKEPRNRTFEAMHQYSYSKLLSTMFNFSARQSLAEKKNSTILQTRRNVLLVFTVTQRKNKIKTNG